MAQHCLECNTSKIKLLSILRIACDVIGEPYECRKIDPETIELSNSQRCRTNKAPQNGTDEGSICNHKINMPNYFRPSANKAVGKRSSEVLTKKIHNEFSNVFSGIGCLRVHSVYRLKMAVDCMNCPQKIGVCFAATPERKSRGTTKAANKSPTRHRQDFQVQEQLCAGPKGEFQSKTMNFKVRLCLDQARLNKALIRLVHRGPTLHDILPRLVGMKYLKPIDLSSGYHNLKLDERFSYLTTFSCPFDRNQYKRLPLRADPERYMFQKKIDKLFSDMPNVFGIADDILIADCDE